MMKQLFFLIFAVPFFVGCNHDDEVDYSKMEGKFIKNELVNQTDKFSEELIFFSKGEAPVLEDTYLFVRYEGRQRQYFVPTNMDEKYLNEDNLSTWFVVSGNYKYVCSNTLDIFVCGTPYPEPGYNIVDIYELELTSIKVKE